MPKSHEQLKMRNLSGTSAEITESIKAYYSKYIAKVYCRKHVTEIIFITGGIAQKKQLNISINTYKCQLSATDI